MSADYQVGLDAAEKGDFETALKEWEPLAEQGYPDAQYNLGVMYRDGNGVPQDHKTAIEFFTLAAEQGHRDAQFGLGVTFYLGRGTTKDYTLACMWLGTPPKEQGRSRRTPLVLTYPHLTGAGLPAGTQFNYKGDLLQFAAIIKRRMNK